MVEKLINYITTYAPMEMSSEDLDILKQAFIPRKFRKRQFLLQEGEVCKFIAFVVKGATRQYTVDGKGNEQVLNLAIEGWWTSDRESFHHETPSVYNIDAWEDTDVLLLPKAGSWYDRVNNIPAFSEMRRKLDDAHHIAAESRLNSYINKSAEVRYHELTDRYPEFLRRFPQHIIASYLGVTKETLSRIRNQGGKRQQKTG